MSRAFVWIPVLCLAGHAAACGRVYYGEPPDAAVVPGTDAAPGADAAPGEPRNDAAPPPPDAGPLDPGLIAWYPLDSAGEGMTEDVSGHGHHAVCVPDPEQCPAIVDGAVGSAMQFDTENHLRVANDGFFDTYGGFTIAIWVWLEPPFYSAPLSKMLGTNTGNSWQFEFSDTRRPALTTSNDKTNSVDYADKPVEAATWVHLAGTWDGTTKRFYVNGVEEYALPFQVDWDGSDFVIGGDENGGAPALMFGGRIDDVRIYDRVLSVGEIEQLARLR